MRNAIMNNGEMIVLFTIEEIDDMRRGGLVADEIYQDCLDVAGSSVVGFRVDEATFYKNNGKLYLDFVQMYYTEIDKYID